MATRMRARPTFARRVAAGAPLDGELLYSAQEQETRLAALQRSARSTERRLSELSAALQRRESDLDTYARKLQRSATSTTRPKPIHIQKNRTERIMFGRGRYHGAAC